MTDEFENEITQAIWNEKLAFVAVQVGETVKQEAEGVTIRMATITCGCGQKRAVVKMFQCLYCSEWFCHSCAEVHFRQTVEQYRKENPIGD